MEIEMRAWLAGLLEGEGCFTMHTTPQIKLQMQDRDVVERAARLLGDRPVYEQPIRRNQTRPAYLTQVQGPKARKIMEEILPWMGERRKAKIRELLF